MKLGEWLERNQLTRSEFARKIGLSKGSISQMCNQHKPWLSRETAELILRATEGAVTPNDFLDSGLFFSPSLVDPEHSRASPDNCRASKERFIMRYSVAQAIEAIGKGELVIVTDDDDRENEGDLICAAALCTPEKMAFIIRHCCGIVCAPLTNEEARRLHLAPMVAANDAPHGTAFTVSVDGKHGLTTGISAEQRSNTVRALANGNMGANDFVRPGHIFPLIAREGGVLMRSGHTEAAVDLCRLAGLPPVGVICELTNDDGTVMAGAQIQAFAVQHGLKRISVADLIAYRQEREKLVERVATFTVEGVCGPLTGYAFRTPYDSVQHFAFVQGEIGDGRDMPARLHRVDIIADVIAGGVTIHRILTKFHDEGRGVLILLRDGTAGVPAQIAGADKMDSEAQRTREWREVGLGAQILRDLGISSIRLCASKPMTYVGLSGFGIEIVTTEGLE